MSMHYFVLMNFDKFWLCTMLMKCFYQMYYVNFGPLILFHMTCATAKGYVSLQSIALMAVRSIPMTMASHT